jgi:hypothetical protein
MSWSFGAPIARRFALKVEDKDNMESLSTSGAVAKVVKFTGSNDRQMTVPELKV